MCNFMHMIQSESLMKTSTEKLRIWKRPKTASTFAIFEKLSMHFWKQPSMFLPDIGSVIKTKDKPV